MKLELDSRLCNIFVFAAIVFVIIITISSFSMLLTYLFLLSSFYHSILSLFISSIFKF